MTGKIKIENENIVIDGDLVTINSIPFATTSAMDIYVRAADGNDSNPGTSALPLATLIEAVARIPRIVRHAVRIHIGPHTGSGYDQPTIRDKVFDGGNIYLYGNGGGGGTDGFTEILASTAALAGSTNVLVVTSGLSTTEFGGLGEYFGATIEILSGAAVGDRRCIHHNTATEIVPNMHFSAAIAEGDTYRIVKPETVIYESDTNSTPVLIENAGDQRGEDYRSEMASRVWLINLRLTCAGTEYRIVGNKSRVQLYGVYSENDFHFLGEACYFSGVDRVPSTTPSSTSKLVTDWGLSSESEWRGWCLVCDSTSAGRGILFDGNTYFEGGCNVPSIVTYSRDKCTVLLFWGSLWGNGGGYVIRAYYGAVFELGGFPFVPIYIGSPTGSSGGVACEGARSKVSFVSAGSSFQVLVQGSGDGIVCKRNGEMVVYCVNTANMQIDVGGIGMKTKERGLIIVTSQVPTITAVGGDFSEDNGETVRDISELAASGDSFSDLVGGVIYRE